MPTSAAQMANSAWVKMGIKPEYIEVELGCLCWLESCGSEISCEEVEVDQKSLSVNTIVKLSSCLFVASS